MVYSSSDGSSSSSSSDSESESENEEVDEADVVEDDKEDMLAEADLPIAIEREKDNEAELEEDEDYMFDGISDDGYSADGGFGDYVNDDTNTNTLGNLILPDHQPQITPVSNDFAYSQLGSALEAPHVDPVDTAHVILNPGLQISGSDTKIIEIPDRFTNAGGGYKEDGMDEEYDDDVE
jgi:hypothetical protein